MNGEPFQTFICSCYRGNRPDYYRHLIKVYNESLQKDSLGWNDIYSFNMYCHQELDCMKREVAQDQHKWLHGVYMDTINRLLPALRTCFIDPSTLRSEFLSACHFLLQQICKHHNSCHPRTYYGVNRYWR